MALRYYSPLEGGQGDVRTVQGSRFKVQRRKRGWVLTVIYN
jgi:hypothetical protein